MPKTFDEWRAACPSSSLGRLAIISDEASVTIHTADNLHADSCEYLDGLFFLQDFQIVDIRPFELHLERRLHAVAIVSAPLC